MVNIYYSIPYIFFLVYITVIFFAKNSRYGLNKIALNYNILIFFGFIFFIGLRGYIYTDWINYYRMYDALPTIWDKSLSMFFHKSPYKSLESGFLIYSIVIKSLFRTYNSWVLINHIIDLCVLFFFFNKYSNQKYLALCFMFFYIFGGITLEFNLYRNVKSLMLFLLSIEYINQKKPIVYFSLNLLGTLFHVSSILYFPLYFILSRKYSFKMVLALFIIGNLIFIFQIHFIKNILSVMANLIGGRVKFVVDGYLKSESMSAPYGLTIGYIERTISFFLIFGNRNQIIRKDNNKIVFINSFYIYIFIYLYCSEIKVVLERLPLLFIFSYWILYPTIYEKISPMKKKIFIVVFILYSFIKLISASNDLVTYYDNQLINPMSIKTRTENLQHYLMSRKD